MAIGAIYNATRSATDSSICQCESDGRRLRTYLGPYCGCLRQTGYGEMLWINKFVTVNDVQVLELSRGTRGAAGKESAEYG